MSTPSDTAEPAGNAGPIPGSAGPIPGLLGPSGSASERRELDLGPIPGFTPPRGRGRYRRWWLVILVVLGIATAAVVSDLPTPQSTRQQATADAGIVKEIATGIHSCAFAVEEAFKTFYVPATNGTLSKVSRGYANQYLNQDQQACSFESTAIFGMATITVPNSPAGSRLSSVIKTVFEWTTSDANGAIVDIRTLVKDPTNAAARRDLASRERLLATDRAKAERDLRGAEADLGGQLLPSLGLPSFPDPARSTS